MSLPKVAVVGARGFASMYIRHFIRLQDAGRIDWTAAVVRSPDKAREEVALLERRGVRIFPDTASMYDTIPDLALVGLPVGIEFHEPLTCEALARECREEIALDIVNEKIRTAVTHAYPDRTIHLTLIDCEPAPGSQPTALEHSELGWFTPEAMSTLDFCPADAELLPVVFGKE